MASLGSNVKVCAPTSARESTRALYCDALGCTHIPVSSTMDVFSFGDGGRVGYEWLDDAAALSKEQQRRAGTWLEFCVDDIPATVAKLDGLGLSRVPYSDEKHTYFAAPGGQVFRLGAR